MDEADLKAMQEEVTDDFRTTWKMLGEVGSGMERMGQQMERMGEEIGGLARRIRECEGGMRQAEERFTLMMQAVTHDHQQIRRSVAELRAQVESPASVPARLEALEKRSPAA